MSHMPWGMLNKTQHFMLISPTLADSSKEVNQIEIRWELAENTTN